MNKKTNSKVLVIVIIVIVGLLLFQNKVFAEGGQARDTNSLNNKTVSYFFELARAMEGETGTLGKESSINTSGNYTDSSGNGIDCHLEKNTEYGAITLLAASVYGNKTSTNSASTANKNTGVFQMNNGSWELVANTWQSGDTASPVSNSYNGSLTRADARYVNKYVGEGKHSITGDGIIETDGWGGTSVWYSSNYPVFYRGGSGLFAYFNDYGSNHFSGTARAVVVCGAGL